MNTARAAFAALLASVPAAAQLTPGQKAPEIKIQEQLNAPVAFASLAEVKGSALMLEFWATW